MAICTVASLSIINIDGVVGRRCVDSRHCLVPRYVISYRSMRMWAVAIAAEQAAKYSASEVDIATGVGIVEFASMSAPL